MTREEATRILDAVIPPPEHHTVDLDHLRIAQAWAYVKETLTAEPVKHGRWEMYGAIKRGALAIPIYRCSECKEDTNNWFWHYCPNCGARMSNDGQIKERSIRKGFDGLTAEKVNDNQIKMEPEEQFRDFASRYGTAGKEDGE